MDKKAEKVNTLLGITMAASLVTGFGALFTAFLASLSDDWVGAGICLVASAIAFGSVAHLIVRR